MTGYFSLVRLRFCAAGTLGMGGFTRWEDEFLSRRVYFSSGSEGEFWGRARWWGILLTGGIVLGGGGVTRYFSCRRIHFCAAGTPDVGGFGRWVDEFWGGHVYFSVGILGGHLWVW